MRILIAPDSYKGTLTAKEAACAIERGISRVVPGLEPTIFPLSDGGDGTVAALKCSLGGTEIPVRVQDPLGRDIETSFLELPDGTAVVEMARASGLLCLKPHEHDPMAAHTFGTGQLLEAARRRSHQIVLGIGGSATVDGGMGMARALGVRGFDESGRELLGNGADLIRLKRLDKSRMSPCWRRINLNVMCDVNNPLLGPGGAVRVFAAQKGASEREAAELEAGLHNLAQVLACFSPKPVHQCPGAGAAGGMGAMLLALFGSVLVPGAAYALNLTNFEAQLCRTQMLITGEGQLDAQSLNQKLPVVLARRARRYGIPVMALPGRYVPDSSGCLDEIFDVIVPLTAWEKAEKGGSTSRLLERAAMHAVRSFLNG